jgi:hypothetical protein
MEAPIRQNRNAVLMIANRFMGLAFPRIPNPTIALQPVPPAAP